MEVNTIRALSVTRLSLLQVEITTANIKKRITLPAQIWLFAQKILSSFIPFSFLDLAEAF